MASGALADLVALLRQERDAQPEDILAYRKQFDASAESASIPPGFSVESVNAGGCFADRLSLLNSADDGVLLYLHGGAYVVGSPTTHRELASRIGRASGCSVLVPEYRLASEHPFPAALEDAVATYRWLIAQGTPPERIVISGDSAGGGRAAAAVLALRDTDVPLPRALVMLSPWTDLAATRESLTTRRDLDPMICPDRICESAQMYLGGADPKTPLASPLYGNLAGFPPTFIHVGTAEVLHDDATRF
ncbi:MAG: alpha/beta hydrolase, partial [Candidatus Hydrogenedentales bacterium]